MTSLLRRDGGGAVCRRQVFRLPAQPVAVGVGAGLGGGDCGGGAGGGVGVPRTRLVAAGVRVDVIAPSAGGGGLCSWAASSSSVSTLRSFTPCSVFLAGGRRSVGWADVLLDAIGVGWKAPSAL